MTRTIAAPAVEASRDLPIRLVRGHDRLAFRAIEAKGRAAAVLNNWGGAGRATVQFPRSAESVVEILSGERVAVRRAGSAVEADIVLKEGGSAVLLAE